MNTCIITCGRLENRYAVEFVEHYKQLGFNHIYIADNNYYKDEHFEEVLQSYIDDQFVTVYDYNYDFWGPCQADSYIKIYNDISNKYDWIFLCDFDEFLVLEKDKTIQDYLSRECFKDKNQIIINWKIYTDNDLIYDDGRGCLERFTTPMEIYKCVQHTWSENKHVKPILRGGFKIIFVTPHVYPDNDGILEKTTCNNCGTLCKNINYCEYDINYDLAYIKHFTTKTIDEWIKYKLIRGTGDRSKELFNLTYTFERFFKYNNITEEKLDYLKEHGFDINDINKEKCKNWFVEDIENEYWTNKKF